MLIDNKVDYTAIGELSGNGVKTVLDFIRKYTSLESGRKGDLDVVTGFFTIAGLDLLYRELAPENKYRLVLSELAGDDDFMSRVINLLHGDLGIEATLKLSMAAKNAIAFLKREAVEVKAISSAFCHAKAYMFKDSADDTHDYYVMGSSNLTEAGLGMRDSSNVELNFANTGSTNSEYLQLRQWFKTQWETVAKAQINIDPKDPKSELVDVKQYFIERIEECFGKTHTPEEIYYKILFELFSGDMDFEGDLGHTKEMTLLQDSTIYRTLFDYQKKGVVSLIKMLRKWNGAILADAVGLGKTFSALAVIKYFQNNGYQTLLL
ncbi:MAG: phospholipase D-like domain-containing protein, partial [Kiritimatiellia bacterium]